MKCGQTVRAGSKVAVLVTCKSIFVFFKFILQPFQVVSSKVTVLVTCKIIFVFSSFFKSFKSSLGRSSWSLHRFGFFLTPHLPRYLLIEILVYQEYFIIAALSTYHKNCRCFCVFQISHNAVVTAPNCQYHLMQIEKIPSEMEVAPRYNCWNCWHCWHCWHCLTLFDTIDMTYNE